MVLLSAMPCDDELETINFTQDNSIFMGHDLLQGETESCYPICVCNCCGQSLIEAVVISFKIKVPSLVMQKQNAFYAFKLPKHNKSIWQPPKLVS